MSVSLLVPIAKYKKVSSDYWLKEKNHESQKK